MNESRLKPFPSEIKIYRTRLGRDLRYPDPTWNGPHGEAPILTGIPLPKRAFARDAGLDIPTGIAFSIKPGEMKQFPTFLVFDIPTDPVPMEPAGHWFLSMQVVNRTGNGGKGLFAAAITFDCGYRPEQNDELGSQFRVRNVGDETLHFKIGEYPVQVEFVPVWVPKIVEVQSPELITWKTERGPCRFGESDQLARATTG